MKVLTVDWKIPEVKDKLEKLWLVEQMSASLCANEMSLLVGKPITRNAVIGAAHRFGWHRPRRPLQARPNPGNSHGRPRLQYRPTPALKQRVTLKVVDEIIITVTEVTLTGGRLRLRFTEWNSKQAMCDAPPPDIVVVPLLQLNDAACHYPFGDPRQPNFGYCGRPKPNAQPYCERCSAWAYMPPEQRKARPAHYTPQRFLPA